MGTEGTAASPGAAKGVPSYTSVARSKKKNGKHYGGSVSQGCSLNNLGQEEL